jgi:4-hydroxy-3-methylbut-2-en-1-yl diphosphate reductase
MIKEKIMLTYLTNPHGYCIGVINAIKMAEQVKFNNPTRPVAILGMLVHNEEVINRLQDKGIFTLYDTTKTHEQLLEDINPTTIIIFSAHGHKHNLEKIAKRRGITYYDATCSRVVRNHDLIKAALKENKQVIYIGKLKHPETIASLAIDPSIVLYDIHEKFSYSSTSPSKPTFVINQTTLSFLEIQPIHRSLEKFYKNITINEEICSATRLRQQAVIDIPKEADLIYIVGSPHSSNTEKLVEIAKKTHPNAHVYRINNLSDIHETDLKDRKLVAIAAGASTPPEITQEIVKYLKRY